MKLHRLPVCIGLALSLLGCSDGPSSSGRGSPDLESTSIESKLVDAASRSIRGIASNAGLTRVELGSESMFRNGRIDDIAITYYGDEISTLDTLKIYNYRLGIWQTLRSTFPLTPIRTTEGSLYYQADRLSSQLPSTTASDFLGRYGRVLLLTDAPGTFTARLVRYNSDYHFRTIRSEGLVWHASMTHENGLLIVSSAYTVRDSLVAYDHAGDREWDVGYEFGHVTNSAFDGSTLWAYLKTESKLLQIDTAGSITLIWDAPLDSIQALVWADSTLWYCGGADTNRGAFNRVDLDASQDAVAVVASIAFLLPPDPITAAAVDSSGFIVAIASSPAQIRRYDFNRQERDVFTCEAMDIEAIAWDGESLWTLHHGPPDAKTDATLLSRFTLE